MPTSVLTASHACVAVSTALAAATLVGTRTQLALSHTASHEQGYAAAAHSTRTVLLAALIACFSLTHALLFARALAPSEVIDALAACAAFACSAGVIGMALAGATSAHQVAHGASSSHVSILKRNSASPTASGAAIGAAVTTSPPAVLLSRASSKRRTPPSLIFNEQSSRGATVTVTRTAAAAALSNIDLDQCTTTAHGTPTLDSSAMSWPAPSLTRSPSGGAMMAFPADSQQAQQAQQQPGVPSKAAAEQLSSPAPARSVVARYTVPMSPADVTTVGEKRSINLSFLMGGIPLAKPSEREASAIRTSSFSRLAAHPSSSRSVTRMQASSSAAGSTPPPPRSALPPSPVFRYVLSKSGANAAVELAQSIAVQLQANPPSGLSRSHSAMEHLGPASQERAPLPLPRPAHQLPPRPHSSLDGYIPRSESAPHTFVPSSRSPPVDSSDAALQSLRRKSIST